MDERLAMHLLTERLASGASLHRQQGLSENRIPIAVEPELFVDPEFRIVGRREDRARVIVLSAPAAVGKSWLARALAARTGNLLIDLGKYNVGSNFFTGTLVKAFGSAAYTQFERSFFDGTTGLILDACDEALVRAGVANFEQCLEDLVDFVRPVEHGRASVVLLGRPESADFACTKLEEAGVPWQRMEVQFFDLAVAEELVLRKSRSTGAGQRGPEKQAAGDLDRALIRLVFEAVRATIQPAMRGAEAEAEAFLGYAPVLDAIAEFASSGNRFGLVQRLEGDVGSDMLWAVLNDVMTSILKREAEKFKTSFVGDGDDGSRQAAAMIVFSPDQQIRMLLTHALNDLEVSQHPLVGTSFEGELVAAVRAQMREHPFLAPGRIDAATYSPLTRTANVAFRDYVVAQAIVKGIGKPSDIVFWATDPLVQPSPILMRIIASSCKAAEIDARFFGLILDSLATNFAEDPDASWRAEVGYGADDEIDSEIFSVELQILRGKKELALLRALMEEGEVLRLHRATSRAVIDLPATPLALGWGGEDFVLGPNVSMRCSTLLADTSHLRIIEGDVYIECKTILGGARSISTWRGGSLAVMTTRAAFPWATFVVAPSGEGEITEHELLSAFMLLRGTWRWFLGSSRRGSYRYPVAAMRIIAAKRRVSRSMLEFLEERGDIHRENYEYVLTLPLNWVAVAAGDLSEPKLRSFLADYVRWSRRHARPGGGT